MAVKIALDMGLLQKLSDARTPLTSENMAKALDKDVGLVRRNMRQLGSSAVVREIARDTYSINDLSKELLTPEASGAIFFLTDVSAFLYAGSRMP